MVKVNNNKSSNRKKKCYFPGRINKLLGANNLVEVLYPVRLFGLWVGVVPFDFVTEHGSTRAALSIPSAIVAISCLILFVSCTVYIFYFGLYFNYYNDNRYNIIICITAFLNVAARFIGTILTYIAIFASRYSDVKIIQSLNEIDDLFEELNEKLMFSKIKLNIICRIVLLQIIVITQVTMNAFLLAEEEDIKWILVDQISLSVPFVVYSTLQLIFRSYVGLLNDITKSLNGLLFKLLTRQNAKNCQQISLNCRFQNNLFSTRDYSRILKNIFKTHSTIYDCGNNISRSFGKRIFLIISFTFVQNIINMFTIFTYIISLRSETSIDSMTFHRVYALSQLSISSCLLYDTINEYEKFSKQVIFLTYIAV